MQNISKILESESQPLSLEFQKALAVKSRQRRLAEARSFKEKYETLLAIQHRSSIILERRGIHRRIWPAWNE
jgi:hypothetical protein